MTETIEIQSDTMELINQGIKINDHTITTKRELNKAIRDLKAQFKQVTVVETKPALPVEPKKSIKGRPKKEEAEKKKTEKQYFVDYYHAKLKEEVVCENCGRYISKGNMNKHKKSDFCKNHPLV